MNADSRGPVAVFSSLNCQRTALVYLDKSAWSLGVKTRVNSLYGTVYCRSLLRDTHTTDLEVPRENVVMKAPCANGCSRAVVLGGRRNHWWKTIYVGNVRGNTPGCMHLERLAFPLQGGECLGAWQTPWGWFTLEVREGFVNLFLMSCARC